MTYFNTGQYKCRQHFYGDSTATKPTSAYKGDKLTELDTGVEFRFNGENWIPIPKEEIQIKESSVVIDSVTYQLSNGNTIRGTNAIKPDAVLAHSVIPYCYYFAIDTGIVEATDGINWVVI